VKLYAARSDRTDRAVVVNDTVVASILLRFLLHLDIFLLNFTSTNSVFTLDTIGSVVFLRHGSDPATFLIDGCVVAIAVLGKVYITVGTFERRCVFASVPGADRRDPGCFISSNTYQRSR